MKDPKTNIDKQTISQDNLLSGLISDGKTEHLQIILSKTHDHQVGDEYLVCSPLGFGVYQLLDINYQEGRIMLTFRNTETDNITVESLDINDTKPQLFLVCWDDIKQMVIKTKTSDLSNDKDLLEYDF